MLTYCINMTETALLLERHVGDLEDAVFCVIDPQSSSILTAKLNSSSVPMVRASSFPYKIYQEYVIVM